MQPPQFYCCYQVVAIKERNIAKFKRLHNARHLQWLRCEIAAMQCADGRNVSFSYQETHRHAFKNYTINQLLVTMDTVINVGVTFLELR